MISPQLLCDMSWSALNWSISRGLLWEKKAYKAFALSCQTPVSGQEGRKRPAVWEVYLLLCSCSPSLELSASQCLSSPFRSKVFISLCLMEVLDRLFYKSMKVWRHPPSWKWSLQGQGLAWQTPVLHNVEELRAGHNLTSILTPFPAHNRGSGILGGDLNITVWSGVRILAVPRAGCVILDRYETILEPWGPHNKRTMVCTLPGLGG